VRANGARASITTHTQAWLVTPSNCFFHILPYGIFLGKFGWLINIASPIEGMCSQLDVIRYMSQCFDQGIRLLDRLPAKGI
jgi:hypothetical protein